MRPTGSTRPAGSARPTGTKLIGSVRTRKPLILSMGDSITAGNQGDGATILPTADRFVYKLAALLGADWQVYPSAISGGTSTGVLVNNRTAWGSVTPDLVTIELGINNNIPNYGSYAAGRTAWEADVRAAVPLLLAHGSLTAGRILICGMPPCGALWSGGFYASDFAAFNTLAASVAASLGCTFIPVSGVYDSGVGTYNPTADPGSYIYDHDPPVTGGANTHPNALGHTQWANLIYANVPASLK